MTRSTRALPQSFKINKMLANATTSEEVLELFAKQSVNFDTVNMTTAAHRLARLSQDKATKEKLRQDERFKRLLRTIVQSASTCSAQGLSNMAWSAAKLRVKHESLMHAVSAAAVQKIDTFNAQELANTAWAFATAECTLGILGERIASAAGKNAADFNSQNLVNLAWAFATLSIRHDKMMQVVSDEACRKVADFNPQGLSNLIWSFAKLATRCSSLNYIVGDRVLHKIQDFKARDLASIIWAFACVNDRQDSLLEVLLAEIMNRTDINAQDLANVTWALAVLRMRRDLLLEAVAEEGLKRISDFNGQSLANVAWAFATLRTRNATLMDSIAVQTIRKSATFSVQGLSNVALAFAKVNLKNEELLRIIAEQSTSRIDEFTGQELATLLWAFAFLDVKRWSSTVKSKRLFDLCLDKCLVHSGSLDSRGLAMTIWAFWRADRFEDAWLVFQNCVHGRWRQAYHEQAGKQGSEAMRAWRRAYGILLMEVERQGDLFRTVALFRELANETKSRNRAAHTAFLNAAVMAYLASDDKGGARGMLQEIVDTGEYNIVSSCLEVRLGLNQKHRNSAASDIVRRAGAGAPAAAGAHQLYLKEFEVFESVVRFAEPGNVESVLSCIEEYSVKENWLKCAGGDKAIVIDSAVMRRKPRLVLEYGSYIGYTSLRLAQNVKRWHGKVVTIEMDPIAATISRNLIELAGLSEYITVHIGHGDDVLPNLLGLYGSKAFQMVFMDQRGTTFHSDLACMEDMGILDDPCVVVADNVLKPGAPLYLWRVCRWPGYHTEIISLQEFADTQIEDWMSVSWLHGKQLGNETQAGRAAPCVLHDLESDTDRLRWRTVAGRAEFDSMHEELARSAAQFKQVMQDTGIVPTKAVATEHRGNGQTLRRISSRMSCNRLPHISNWSLGA